ncbi:jg3254 [Pararge aegeria aegeria]|uniref:Jg3254 protein n=2 Tax=Pararge aegeria TaxID=116150 RepID=A0A8S4RUB3_9NEOP|nr:jg3254 [Pararge aegeria aegeria]
MTTLGRRVGDRKWYFNMVPRWLLACCVVLLARPAHPQGAQQCPPQNTITPCSCTVKKNGLDILCEFTEQQHIQKAMNTLRSKPMIIFYLKLRHNNLAKLPSYIFLSLDIRHLTVHNSSLAVIEDSSLSSIGNKLTQLDVSQNNLATIPTSSFTHLNHLLILNMNHNKVTAIHNRAFLGLDTLEILTLYENKISVVDGEAFKGLEKKLKRLNLGGNELTAVPQKALALLENLKKLEMQENRITTISEGDFAGLRNLDSLGLAHNQLREVPANVFSHLTFLNSLELEGNQIQRIDEKAFAGLEENLQYLRLGDNRLHDIPSEALRPLHRLRHLDLRSNNITYISEDAFTGYGDSITFLNMQKNMVHQLPTMGFDNLNSLETLNLQNNKLQHIPEEIMEPILDTLRVVDIMDNPLICDCDLAWYEFWLAGLRERDDEMMQKKRTICTMVSEHREYSVAKMPLDKMNCLRKPGHGGRSSVSNTCPILATNVAFAVIVRLF